MSGGVILDADYIRQKARAEAFMQSMHGMKGTLGGGRIRTPKEAAAHWAATAGTTTYDTLRERYATGKISLGEFEAEVTVMLRGMA